MNKFNIGSTVTFTGFAKHYSTGYAHYFRQTLFTVLYVGLNGFLEAEHSGAKYFIPADSCSLVLPDERKKSQDEREFQVGDVITVTGYGSLSNDFGKWDDSLTAYLYPSKWFYKETCKVIETDSSFDGYLKFSYKDKIFFISNVNCKHVERREKDLGRSARKNA